MSVLKEKLPKSDYNSEVVTYLSNKRKEPKNLPSLEVDNNQRSASNKSPVERP